MSLRNTAPRFLVLSLCALTRACSGNDAKRCKVTTLDDGGVRVACPGSPAIVLPPGADSTGDANECSAELDPQTGEYTLRCKETVVSLGRCGLGVESDLFLGDESDEFAISLPPELRRNNWRTIAEAQEKGCDRVLGTVWISEEGAERYHDFLQTLTYAQVIEFIGPVEGLSLPELRAAQIRVGDRPKVWATLRAPNLRAGGVEIIGGSYEGALDFDNFVSAHLRVNGVQGVTELNARELRAGHIEFANLPDLVRIELPKLRIGASVSFAELRALEALELPELLNAAALTLAGVGGANTIEFPKLEYVETSVYVTELGDVERLAFPELTDASQFHLSFSQSLTSLSLPKLVEADYWIEIRDMALLEDVELSSLVRAGELLLNTLGELSALHLPMARDIPHVMFNVLPSLALLQANALQQTESFSLFSVASEVPEGIDIELNSLDAVEQLGLDSTVIRSLSLQALRTIGNNQLVLADTPLLRSVVVPNLENTAVRTTLTGTHGEPVRFDLRNFKNSTVGFGLAEVRIVGTQSQEVSVDVSNAEIAGTIEIENVHFTDPLSIGAGVTGTLRLTDIPTGDQIQLKDATGLTTIDIYNVGSLLSMLDGTIGAREAQALYISESYVHDLEIGLASDGTIALTLEQVGVATGNARVYPGSDPSARRWFVWEGGPTDGGSIDFTTIDLSGFEDVVTRMRVGSVSHLLLPSLVYSAQLEIAAVALQTLDVSSFTGTHPTTGYASSIDWDLGMTPLTSIVVPSGIHTDVLGEMKTLAHPAVCPPAMEMTYPMVSYDYPPCN